MRDPTCFACKGPEHEDDSFRICELEFSMVMLNEDQNFLGYTFVTFKEQVEELYHLPPDVALKFFKEMLEVADALDKTFRPDKMNYAVLGNIVPHLHRHLIPRYKTDPAWGRPPKFVGGQRPPPEVSTSGGIPKDHCADSR